MKNRLPDESAAGAVPAIQMPPSLPWHEIKHAGLRESVRTESHDPGSVGADVAVRRPCGVNRSVDLQQPGPLLILFWIEDYISAAVVVAVPEMSP